VKVSEIIFLDLDWLAGIETICLFLSFGVGHTACISIFKSQNGQGLCLSPRSCLQATFS